MQHFIHKMMKQESCQCTRKCHDLCRWQCFVAEEMANVVIFIGSLLCGDLETHSSSFCVFYTKLHGKVSPDPI